MLALEPLEKFLLTQQLDDETKLSLKNQFTEFYLQAAERKDTAMAIVVKDENDKVSIAKAKELRINLKKVRGVIEKKREEMKEESLRRGQAIDGVARLLKDTIKPLEDYLESQEKYAAIMMEKKRNELIETRKAQCDAEEIDYTFVSLGDMDEETYQKFFAQQKELIDSRKKFLEEQAVKEAEEQARRAIELEQERAARAESDRQAAESRALAEQEQARRLKIEADLANERRIAAEQKAEQDRIEAERLKKIELEEQQKKIDAEKAAAAPDKEKLAALAQMIKDLSRPQMSSDTGKKSMDNINLLIDKLYNYILSQCQN